MTVQHLIVSSASADLPHRSTAIDRVYSLAVLHMRVVAGLLRFAR